MESFEEFVRNKGEQLVNYMDLCEYVGRRKAERYFSNLPIHLQKAIRPDIDRLNEIFGGGVV